MVQGLKLFKRKMTRQIPERIAAELLARLAADAEELAAAQRALVRRDEGALEDSIRVERPAGRLAVDVRAGGPTTTRPVRAGAKAFYDYALAQEFGTENQPAAPFFYPPYRQRRGKFKSRLARATKKAIKAGAR